jgi:hypothetical protein
MTWLHRAELFLVIWYSFRRSKNIRLLLSPKSYCHTHKSPLLNPILGQLNPVLTLTLISFSILFSHVLICIPSFFDRNPTWTTYVWHMLFPLPYKNIWPNHLYSVTPFSHLTSCKGKRKSCPCNRPWSPMELWDVLHFLDNRLTDGG